MSLDESFGRALAASMKNLGVRLFDLEGMGKCLKTIHLSSKESEHNDGESPTSSQLEGTDSSLYYTFVIRYPSTVEAKGTLKFDLTDAVKDAARDEEDPTLVEKYAAADVGKALLAMQKKEYEGYVKDYKNLVNNLPAKIEDKIVQEIWRGTSSKSTAYRYHYDEVDLSEYPGLSVRWHLRSEKVTFGAPKKTGSFTYEVGFGVLWWVEVDKWTYGEATWKRDIA